MRVFKSELREAMKDPSQLPGDELFESVEYSDGSDEAFLRRLWHDLYGDETPYPCYCPAAAGSTLAKPRTSGNGGSSPGLRST